MSSISIYEKIISQYINEGARKFLEFDFIKTITWIVFPKIFEKI